MSVDFQLHGVPSQMMELFTTTTVRTSYSTQGSTVIWYNNSLLIIPRFPNTYVQNFYTKEKVEWTAQG
jgi:hypothetical protein